MNRWMIRSLAAASLAAFATGVAAAAITGPQKKLPTETITIVNQHGKRFTFTVEKAITPKQQEVGLMFRKKVKADEGMIFPWNPPQVSEMWMKNTLVPLDMVFVGPHGTIRHIANDTVPESLRIISSGVKVAATIELQGGITAKDDIDVGDKVIGPQFGDAS